MSGAAFRIEDSVYFAKRAGRALHQPRPQLQTLCSSERDVWIRVKGVNGEMQMSLLLEKSASMVNAPIGGALQARPWSTCLSPGGSGQNPQKDPTVSPNPPTAFCIKSMSTRFHRLNELNIFQRAHLDFRKLAGNQFSYFLIKIDGSQHFHSHF